MFKSSFEYEFHIGGADRPTVAAMLEVTVLLNMIYSFYVRLSRTVRSMAIRTDTDHFCTKKNIVAQIA